MTPRENRHLVWKWRSHDPLSGMTSARVPSAAGVVAIALALAGAEVVAADLPRVTPLARANAAANCRAPPHRIQARTAQGRRRYLMRPHILAAEALSVLPSTFLRHPLCQMSNLINELGGVSWIKEQRQGL